MMKELKRLLKSMSKKERENSFEHLMDQLERQEMIARLNDFYRRTYSNDVGAMIYPPLVSKLYRQGKP